jgi:large subunit ribosomal protein L22
MFKRLMPRARGMAYLVRRRTAHINVGLADASSWVPGDVQEAARAGDDKD